MPRARWAIKPPDPTAETSVDRVTNHSSPRPLLESISKNKMSKLKIKPVGDRILVQHIEEKEQVRGGVIIPDSAKEKPQEAKVIALGTGTKTKEGALIPFEVKVGDTVLIGK